MNKTFARLKFPAAVLLLLLLLFHIPAVVDGVRGALIVCAVSIIPSLFVFMVAADLTVALTAQDLRFFSPKYAVFLLGALCGFPVGALVCERLAKAGVLTEKDAARLLPVTNNASPAFVVGAVGGMLGDRKFGVLLFLSQIAASLLFLLPMQIRRRSSKADASPISVSSAFFGAVENAVHGVLRISGLICLFSALLAVLEQYIPSQTVFAAFAALLEIGSGTARCAALFPKMPIASVVLCAFACGWSGICVHMQIFSVLKSIKVNKTRFFFFKLAQGLLTAVFAGFGCKFLFWY